MNVGSVQLTEGWSMASTTDALPSPAEACALSWIPTRLPATVASVLREHKQWQRGSGARFDASDHWFRCQFPAPAESANERASLRFDGIATLAEIWLNGELILTSQSMFAANEIDVTGKLQPVNDLVIVCRSLARCLKEKRRQQPAARWRTRVVAEQQLRWFRTTMLGRAPGFAPEPEPVGPWRPVSLRRRSIAVENFERTTRLDGDAGIVSVSFISEGPGEGLLTVGEHSAPLQWDGPRAHATLRIPSVNKWWPHTHGAPALYPLRVEVSGNIIEESSAGFRAINSTGEGLSLNVNGIAVFSRGLVWMPPDIVSLASSPETLRHHLTSFRDSGFNLIRIPGTTFYQDETFHSLCDELGLLVWQDMMFANMDYPFADAAFHQRASEEAVHELSRLSRHPSTAVLCGNSEIEQQAAMFGTAAAPADFFASELPAMAAQHCPGVPYIPSAPYGGDLPFHPGTGVANYYGVGAYLRPLEDARRAEVRFAAECLAFANVPEQEMMDEMSAATPGGITPTHPNWKRGVPRDGGAGWDFEDVRDHYLKLLYSVDAAQLRYADATRYFELSRMVTGEVMAEVFGEWRRPKSPSAGGIILWSSDLEPGAGWGILDSSGRPKSTYWFLKRALAPRAIWTTDEGLNGIDIHVANDTPTPLTANLRVALYKHGEKRIEEKQIPLALAAHESRTMGIERILGHFVDSSYAYRFGPPGHDVVVASLHADGNEAPFAQTFRFPLGRSAERVPISELGITGQMTALPDGRHQVVLTSRKLAYGVRLSARTTSVTADDSYYNLEPGIPKNVMLNFASFNGELLVTAVNGEGRVTLNAGAHS